MPPLIPGAPWWANLLLVIGVVIVTSATTLTVTHFTTRGQLKEIKSEQKAIKHQVVNDHGDAPNLRQDVDELKAAAKSQALVAERLERFMVDLDKTLRAQAHSLERRDALQTQALKTAIEDRKRETAAAIDQALTQHVAGCPARQNHTPKENS